MAKGPKFGETISEKSAIISKKVGGKIQKLRTVEAFIGEYASGKSEIAINRALQLLGATDKEVTIVDLDLIEPFYTLRTLKKELESLGLRVIAPQDSFGLGETGNVIHPGARWALRYSGDIIFDIGYGADGGRGLNLVEGLKKEKSFSALAVVNAFRPITFTPRKIKEFLSSLPRVDGIINNSHLGEETTVENIIKGGEVVVEGARLAGLPLVASAVQDRFKSLLTKEDLPGVAPLWLIKLFFSSEDRKITKM